jgi:hypothetical protein
MGNDEERRMKGIGRQGVADRERRLGGTWCRPEGMGEGRWLMCYPLCPCPFLSGSLGHFHSLLGCAIP